MAAKTVYRFVRVVGGAAVLVGATMFVFAAFDSLTHHRGPVSMADWGRPSSGAWIGVYGLGVAAFGLMLRAKPIYGPWRDFAGRLLHVVTLTTAPHLIEVGAKFSAPPDAPIGHATADEMQAAMVQFAIPVILSALVAYWVSGFLPFLTVNMTSKE
ncbi:hypothetical protein SAMN05421837_103726 [Amycolatopsis pretoriensis]|uniref:Uncharacterized protein n=1 Tax=Amycolatopsis pretoriensis TaxID=218821 RepID=A0A1H5QMN4_9PSEU|nr:hypothetical protein [Amycolatopsis pretoriensis]SEF27295.1 hypothetical protein SAMN05421837_103726 [Amycolatopsis pretoriensis]